MPERFRYFCMGSALVVPMITRMGKVLDRIKNRILIIIHCTVHRLSVELIPDEDIIWIFLTLKQLYGY